MQIKKKSWRQGSACYEDKKHFAASAAVERCLQIVLPLTMLLI
jgi:hypothetical protein